MYSNLILFVSIDYLQRTVYNFFFNHNISTVSPFFAPPIHPLSHIDDTGASFRSQQT